MGNVSTTTQKLQNEIINTMKSSCKNSHDVNQEISGVNIEASKCKNIDITNTSTTSATCDMAQTSESLAEAYNQASSQQKSQLNLINADNKEQTITNIIKNKLNTECGSTNQIKQRINNNTIKVIGCDNLNLANKSNIQTQCVLQTLSQSINKIDNKAETTQGGDIQDIVKDLKGNKGAIIGGLVVLGLIVLVITYLIKTKTKPSSSSSLKNLAKPNVNYDPPAYTPSTTA
jgi:hypothetical protein